MVPPDDGLSIHDHICMRVPHTSASGELVSSMCEEAHQDKQNSKRHRSYHDDVHKITLLLTMNGDERGMKVGKFVLYQRHLRQQKIQNVLTPPHTCVLIINASSSCSICAAAGNDCNHIPVVYSVTIHDTPNSHVFFTLAWPRTVLGIFQCTLHQSLDKIRPTYCFPCCLTGDWALPQLTRKASARRRIKHSRPCNVSAAALWSAVFFPA